ncbi:capsid maturation protease [Arthrobacter phage Sonali]|uniref:Capsid maturation protease n=1 Tax=Arthrobacter phage Sonali TaxID=2510495 RepID=A0A411CQB9_9CAUD|nr:head maturation protease [Arthrobacter phage Sonali]QAY16118.1 capsid maturation protease [Arthrobacter phage Sonali]
MTEERYVLGIAYPADRVDGHGEYMTQETVQKAAWGYLQHGQIGLHHADGTVGHATVVESYIYRGPDWKQTAADGSEQIVKSGDWLVGAVFDEPTWALIKSGQFNGWSIQGLASRRPATEEKPE